MRRDFGKIQMAAYGALTVAAVAYWVYYIVVLAPQAAIHYDYTFYNLLEFLVQPLFYGALSALLVTSLRRAGKLSFSKRVRRICFAAAVVLIALYVLSCLPILLQMDMPDWSMHYYSYGMPVIAKHEELFLIPGILWGLGVGGLGDAEEDYWV